MDKRIGAQLYTVRNSCQTEPDFAATVKRLHEIGYKVIQISGIGDFAPEFVRDICETYGMTVACVHWDLGDFENRPDYVVHYQKTINCHIAGLGYIPPENRKNFEDIRALVEKLNGFYDRMAEDGIVFAHHNHAFEFARYDGICGMAYMQEHGKFDFILDVYWLAYAGIEPAGYIKKLGDRCRILHYKDLCVTNMNAVKYAPVGSGNLDWDAIIAASDKAEFALVEQDECDEPPIDCLAKSYAFLQTKGFT